MALAGLLALAFTGDASALPSFESVRSAWRPSEAELLDRHGVVIQTLRIDPTVRRLDWVSLKEVSPALREALLLSEDRRFYAHAGVDWQAIGAAAWANLWNTRTRGASTITMQLAGLLEDDLKAGAHGRSLTQKVEQTAIAWQLERTWRKDQILEAYLNLVTFRGEVSGIGAVAQTIFQKYPSGLDQREAALAAALVRAPNASAGAVAERACKILSLQGNAAECRDLPEYAREVLSRKSVARLDRDTNLAPHLLRHLLAAAQKADSVAPAPTRIASTLDADLQRMAQATLEQQLAQLAHRNVADGAVIVLDNASGEVLAWVGSSGPASGAEDVDGVLALRQAGSTLKPFLYEIALEKRWLTAASVLSDTPLDLAVGRGLYVPEDYEKDFKGPVSLRTALGSSLNVPAVRTLLLVTPERFAARLSALGLPLAQTGDYYGYSLALGSAEVTLASLANAYRALAAQGRYSPYRVRQGGPARAAEHSPQTPGDAHAEPVPILDPAASFIITDILADRNARALTFGMDSLLNTPFWSAVKTGTSKDMRDNWCVGFSRRYTVGVWVGNPNGTPMWDVSGVSGAAPIWRAVLQYLESPSGGPAAPFVPTAPPGVVRGHVRFDGALEAARDEWFVAGTVQSDVVLAGSEGVAASLIRAPADHTIIALDPDIPPASQHLTFRSVARLAHAMSWRLDGKRLAPADPFDWPLWPGDHLLELVDAHGVVMDRVHFEVRGAQVRLPRAAHRTG